MQTRLERQELLSGAEPLELWAAIDEAAVRRMVGGQKTMHAQVTHLIDATRQANVTVQVIPFDTGAHPGMPGSFVYMDFKDPADPELVYIDTMAGDLFKSSYSSANGQCVESARRTDGGIALRDSKQPDGVVLRFGTQE